jgi:hypothetical protein
MFPATVLAKHLERSVENERAPSVSLPQGAVSRVRLFLELALQEATSQNGKAKPTFALVREFLPQETISWIKWFLELLSFIVKEREFRQERAQHFESLKVFLSALHKKAQDALGLKIEYLVDGTTS